jgi:serine protease inhibitor
MPWPIARNVSKKLSAVFASDVPETSSSASTRFAFKLFHELATADASNVFFSPSSVMLCLAMVHELASGETRQAMAKALEIADLAPADAQLAIATLKAAFRPRPDLTVKTANSFWCCDRAQVRPELAAKLRDLYDAELTSVDLAATDAVPRINAWVSDKTNGMIGHIIDQLPPLAVLVAINAVYFKGRWTIPFIRPLTRDRPFTTASGQTKQLPLMLQSGNYDYYEDSRLQAVALPYLGSMAMHVVLPAERTDLQQFQRSLTSGSWESWLAKLEPMPGTIGFPRFKLDYFVPLERALKALGMERAFDRNRAEFDGIQAGEQAVWIDKVVHRAVAEVNEEGTEAAAVTMATECFSASRPRPPRMFQMIVNRPFFIAIRDEATGTILFMGWIGDPQ